MWKQHLKINMKKLILFEAFQSNILSKINKFLTNKFGDNLSREFIKKMRDDLDNLPIDKLTDNDIQYLNKSRGLSIKGEEPNNPLQVSHIKYWFSLKDGYLLTTGTNGKNNFFETNGFSKKQLKYIEENITKTGNLLPVDDYNELKTGDKVIGLFHSNVQYDYQIAISTIYIYHERIYAINSKSGGSQPPGSEWMKFGNRSWFIGDVGDRNGANDHHHLSFYEESDTIVSYRLSDDNHFFNIPYRMSKLISWKSTEINLLKLADFCIVINVNNFFENITTISKTKEDRENRKEGATKLLTDDQIKDININRYGSIRRRC